MRTSAENPSASRFPFVSTVRRMFPVAPFSAMSLALAALAPSANAQFNNAWLTLVQDSNRLKTPAGAVADIVSNGDEKDFAVADLNKDGWPDVACGKKIQVSFVGPREGRLFMNEKGTLVDRTTEYASLSLTPGDSGFKTALDTRDVEFADFNGDGWLDMVTSQTDLANDTSTGAKVHTHPRIYINLGNDASGHWLGLRHEDNRIPQLKTIPGNLNGVVRFCQTAVGDVDLDGDKDLYFADYDTDENQHTEPSNLDLNNRLLLNDGNGFFTDASSTNFNSTSMLTTAFGTECDIKDMNGDGKPDIIQITTLTDSPNRAECLYNNVSASTTPNFTGGFDLKATIDASGQNYAMANVDINNDGKLDHLVGDDATDHYRFNTGNSALGTVNWSASLSFSWLTGSGDDGFAGQVSTADFNLDGWMDAIIYDVDIDLAGCSRRTKIYHNMGGTPGATNIVMREEAQQSGTGGWKGAVGWSSTYPKGMNDAALVDIDHDGDTDIVIGGCSGTDVWMNQTNPIVCQTSVLATSLGDGQITVCGAPLWSNLTSTLNISGGAANGFAVLLAGFNPTTLPLFGGQVMVPFSLVFTLPLNASGAASFTIGGGGGNQNGLNVYVQALLGATGNSLPTDITNIVRLDLRS